MFKKNKKTKKYKKRSAFSNIGIGEERDNFVENMSMLFRSGMSVVEVLNSVGEEASSKVMKQIIGEIKEKTKDGMPLWQSLKEANIFKDHIVSLIRVGEESGNLSKNLNVIAIQQRKDRDFRSKLRSAMMYPVLVFSLALIVGTGIAWFILPKLALIFSQMKLELPWITRVLIAVGEFLQNHGLITVLSAIVFLSIFFYLFFINRKLRFIGQAMILKIPGIKRLIQEIEVARLGYVLGTLLESGLPVVSAVNSIYDAAVFKKYKDFYKFLKNYLETGHSFQKSFEKYKDTNKLIPVPVQQMIVAGEQSGNLAPTFLQVGETYDKKIENTSRNLTILLEPLLLVIIWLAVISVALAVILPIYSLVGGINKAKQGRNSSSNKPPTEASVEVSQVDFKEDSEGIVEEIEIVTELKILPTGTGSLNVREEASTSSTIIGEVKEGDILKYLEEDEGWYEIVIVDEETKEEKTGWVLGEFIEVVQGDESEKSKDEESEKSGEEGESEADSESTRTTEEE